MIRIGCAGWSLPRAARDRFPEGEGGLPRYAAVFNCTEINSSFHRPHGAGTYERWAASVPAGFRFSVKVAKAITHGAGLAKGTAMLDEFLAPVRSLGEAFGCLLVQLPPKLEFDAGVAKRFFAAVKARGVPAVALEPRHASWFVPAADALLAGCEIARVAADPPRAPGGGQPGGWPGFSYHRLHGTPRMYYSAYEPAFLDALAADIASRGLPGWCIFDNTAGSAAVPNAIGLMERLETDDNGRHHDHDHDNDNGSTQWPERIPRRQ